MWKDLNRKILFLSETVSVTCPAFVFLIITLNSILFLGYRSPRYCVEWLGGVEYEYSSTRDCRNNPDLLGQEGCISVLFAVCLRPALLQRTDTGRKQNSSIISDHMPLIHASLAQSHGSEKDAAPVCCGV